MGDFDLNILLVEPSYKNKYPPMGLMKISTYHKGKGDMVLFYKGLMEREVFLSNDYDRVYITSLFTFHYEVTLNTIRHYANMIEAARIFVGGIMVTLMNDRLSADLNNNVVLLKGLVEDSSAIGFDDHINIDVLPLDYSILDDIPFKYSAGDNYFAYLSRGCTNKCEFCAVPILEPHFCLTNNIIGQINAIRERFGEKQNLLLLDNNILSLDVGDIQAVVDDMQSLGFCKNAKYYPELPLLSFIRKLSLLEVGSVSYSRVQLELLDYLYKKSNTKKSKNYQEKYNQLICQLDEQEDKLAFIQSHLDVLVEILGYYHKPAGRKRTIDFNQGIDARQLTEEKMAALSQLPIEPFRLAFDSLSYRRIYIKAVKLAAKYGVTSFSNYLLYNYKDSPAELWERLRINIDLAKECNIRIFSFPMKYAPIDRTDRSYVGDNWNRHFLSNLYAILNVTKGIVAEGEEFFYKAFGSNVDEFLLLLSMPRDFVVYRSYFESNDLSTQWRKDYASLTKSEQDELINALCEKRMSENQKVNQLLRYYTIKKQDDRGSAND